MENGSKKPNNNSQTIKVYVRQRPFAGNEDGLLGIVKKITNEEIKVRNGNVTKGYHFDGVFNSAATQEDVYKSVVHPLISYIISGYNCTVFAYGQTGSGKTHTMIGNEVGPNIDFEHDPNSGMIPRASAELFACLANQTAGCHTVRISFIEIYNEEVRDLLSKDPTQLRIFDDRENRGSVYLKGMTEQTVCSTRELYSFLSEGIRQRQSAATNLNRNSSRSHSLFTIVVHMRQTTAAGAEVIKTGKLYLVDLAGSENIGRSGATEARAREAGTINKSLLTLGKVIKALASKNGHVPYRDSKLTRILQDSLGGKTKTCMIANISPTVRSWDETISTLEYAHDARSVENCPQVNIKTPSIGELKELQTQLDRLRADLAVARSGEGFYIVPERYNELTENANRVLDLNQKIKALEEVRARKELELNEVNQSFADTKLYLDQVERKLKQQDIALNHYQVHSESLEKTAKQLLNVCNRAVDREAIFQLKYRSQSKRVLSNAAIVANFARVYKKVRKDLQAALDSFQAYATDQRASSTIICGTLQQLIEDQRLNLQELETAQKNLIVECRDSIDDTMALVDEHVEQIDTKNSEVQAEIIKLRVESNVDELLEMIDQAINNVLGNRDTVTEMFATQSASFHELKAAWHRHKLVDDLVSGAVSSFKQLLFEEIGNISTCYSKRIDKVMADTLNVKSLNATSKQTQCDGLTSTLSVLNKHEVNLQVKNDSLASLTSHTQESCREALSAAENDLSTNLHQINERYDNMLQNFCHQMENIPTPIRLDDSDLLRGISTTKIDNFFRQIDQMNCDDFEITETEVESAPSLSSMTYPIPMIDMTKSNYSSRIEKAVEEINSKFNSK